MAIAYCYWHLVVKNVNFTLLLTCSCQEWQFHIATDIKWSRMAIDRSTPQMHHGIHIMGCIWQTFCLLQEKVGISCYVSIIRVVNSQLVLYSHVRCNPPPHPQNTPKWELQFQIWGLIFLGVICNIVVKAHLGRSAGRPTPKCIMGYILWDVSGSHVGFFKKRVGISSYFWIIRIVNSQLELYSHVRCNPHWHALHTPKRPHKWPLQISTMRAHICQF